MILLRTAGTVDVRMLPLLPRGGMDMGGSPPGGGPNRSEGLTPNCLELRWLPSYCCGPMSSVEILNLLEHPSSICLANKLLASCNRKGLRC